VPDDAVESVLRALEHRDRSSAQLERRLTEAGFGPEDRERALETLQRPGLVDDARFARNRAESLAARGAGDALVRHDLAAAGVHGELAEDAIARLEPELERAQRIVRKRGASPKTARYLHGRGYSHDVVSAAVATDDVGELR
jgi:regulatory protein